MEFYNNNNSYGTYGEIRTLEPNITEGLTDYQVGSLKVGKQSKKLHRFSDLSAEERWNFSRKINQLQQLINAIQSEMNSNVSSGFTLEEVLEVLTVRRTMHNDFEK